MIFINTSSQKLYLFDNNKLLSTFKISTSLYGVGCLQDSNKTPNGLHTVVSKIGNNISPGTIFKNRVPTSKIIRNIPKDNHDYITTRIIRLGGLEEGINRGNNVDSYNRYIYIHGTPHVDKLGQARSHGCIRMSDSDVINLFNLVELKMLVLID